MKIDERITRTKKVQAKNINEKERKERKKENRKIKK